MYKLEIDLLPKGAWNNDFSKTLPKKEWDRIRNICYEKSDHHCQICGTKTDVLNAHEVWCFDIKNKTQTLKNIIAICTKCHGVIHIKNTIRLGYGQEAMQHFIKVNNCTEMDFAKHLTKAIMTFDQLNKVYRWKIIADLSKFGGDNTAIKTKNIPFIYSPYNDVKWNEINYSEMKNLFLIRKTRDSLIGVPKIVSVAVDNYQGKIIIDSLFADKIEWYVDDKKIKIEYIGK